MPTPNPNLNSPNFGPTSPVYPELTQFVRVTGATVGGNVYPCVVQQSGGNAASSRDRETAWLWEPNGTTLITDGTGYYLCRLIGSFTNGGNTYPLLETMAFPSSGGSAIKVQETEAGTPTLTINPCDTIQFEIGVDGSQGVVTNPSGNIARYAPWSLTVVDLVPTTELRTTELQFGTNFYISEPSANTTRVDFGMTVDDLVVNTVTKVQHLTFQGGFTVTVNATTGHAFVAFSGSAYSLTVADEAAWTLAGIVVTLPQPAASAGTPVGGCVTLDFLYPLYVTTPGATDATVSCLLADQTHSGYVDHGENNSGSQDFAGNKRFHRPSSTTTTDDNNYVKLDGNATDIFVDPGPMVSFSVMGTYGGAAPVVDGALIRYFGQSANLAELDLWVTNQNNTSTTQFNIQGGVDRTAITDPDSNQTGLYFVNKPFYTIWHSLSILNGLCKSYSNGQGSVNGQEAPDDESQLVLNIGALGTNGSVENNACFFVFSGGLYMHGGWTPPMPPQLQTPTNPGDPGYPAPLNQYGYGAFYLLGQSNPGTPLVIDWQEVNDGLPYDPGHSGGATNYKTFYGVSNSGAPRPSSDFITIGAAIDQLTNLFFQGTNKPGVRADGSSHTIPLRALNDITGSLGSVTVKNSVVIDYVDPT